MTDAGGGPQIDAQELSRLRWQCRRGLLELDLVLERFLEKHRDRLQGERLSSFQTLLTYTDDELWDLIRARTECRDARFAEVLQWMRDCRDRTGSQ
jgi:antitoxin CptB